MQNPKMNGPRMLARALHSLLKTERPYTSGATHLSDVDYGDTDEADPIFWCDIDGQTIAVTCKAWTVER